MYSDADVCLKSYGIVGNAPCKHKYFKDGQVFVFVFLLLCVGTDFFSLCEILRPQSNQSMEPETSCLLSLCLFSCRADYQTDDLGADGRLRCSVSQSVAKNKIKSVQCREDTYLYYTKKRRNLVSSFLSDSTEKFDFLV